MLCPCYGQNVEVLAKTVMVILRRLGLATNNLVGVCTDGEAAMTGCNQGAVTHLQKECPTLVTSVQCMAHQTNLVTVDAEKHHSLVSGLTGVLSGVGTLFHCKTGKLRLWQKHCAQHGVKQCAWDTYNSTRWFSRSSCACQLVSRLHLLLSFLSAWDVPGTHMLWADAVVICDMLLEVELVFALLCFCDLLSPAEQLRKELESNSGRLSRTPEVKRACSAQLPSSPRGLLIPFVTWMSLSVLSLMALVALGWQPSLLTVTARRGCGLWVTT